ncbi:MAG TPA: crosslink repair DNA glycosylase YcaQ family protein [Candidatus Limnocylindria bacterium]|nr:crosslink repair DNA glycosylase YcaQ family protein [Candidatus Limnocylindria bacterium]
MRRRSASLDDALAAHRERLARAHRVRNKAGLLAMIDDLGFCFAFTLRTGDAPLPAGFDHLATTDEGKKWEWMWGWKDEIAEAKEAYYGALLVRKPTFVSKRLLPAFYATFGRAGEPDDHLEDVRAGRLSDLGRRVVEFLTQNGETQTKRMRATLGIVSKEGKREYDKAVDEVQRLMYVSLVRAVGETHEDYNYTYDLFTRRYPEAVRAAERLASAEAAEVVLGRALELAGAMTPKQAERLFDWEADRVARTAARLERAGRLARTGTGKEALFVLASLLARKP